MSDNNFKRGPHTAKNRPVDEQVEVIENASGNGVDERKTVVLDEDLEGVEFEDKVWLYWTRNKNFIILTLVLAVAIVIGVQGYKLYKAQAAANLAGAYEAAVTQAQLADFAAKNSGTKLAGVALLENGDSSYAERKYADAVKSYTAAAQDLKDNILYSRAMLGIAAATYASGDSAKGIEKLSSVYNDGSVEQLYRAQAGYLLGLAYQQRGKLAEAKKIFIEIADNAKNGVFANISRNVLSKME